MRTREFIFKMAQVEAAGYTFYEMSGNLGKTIHVSKPFVGNFYIATGETNEIRMQKAVMAAHRHMTKESPA